ncbi:acyltransferase [Longimicrobium sp.]|uniref:acyltransferase family protein n=1 Tax=Longimicrobium sp. TaxID=2029185 RepID=UPI002E358FFD|nr:acyltransferase [Longimicrobium sp.]HEX6036754.1 acyltransferase [Longimicrobium sp.]
MGEQTKPHLGALTGLRFVAAFQVLAYHTLPLTDASPAWLRALVGTGYVGVSLFFVLSGFVLTYTYHDTLTTGAVTRREFLVARVARLYPVYLLSMAFAVPALLWWMQRKHIAMDLGWLARLVGLSGGLLQAWNPRTACVMNCPAWSLSVEAFFYVAFLFVLPVVPTWGVRRLLAAGAAAWALSLAAPIVYLALRPDGPAAPEAHSVGVWLYSVKYNPLLRLPEFVMGVLAGRLFLLERRPWLTRRMRLEVSAAIVLLAALIASPRIPFLLLHNGLLAPVFAALVYALARGEGALSRVLSVRALARLGTASFALYILHIPLAAWMERGLGLAGAKPPQPWYFATYAAFAIGVSLAVHAWVEEPMRRVVRRRLSPPPITRDTSAVREADVAQMA